MEHCLKKFFHLEDKLLRETCVVKLTTVIMILGCKQGGGCHQQVAGEKARRLGFAPGHQDFPRNQWSKEEILQLKRQHAHIIRIGN